MLSFLSVGDQKPQVARRNSELPVPWNVCCGSYRSFHPSGTTSSRPAEFKVMGTGSKSFPSGSLGMIVCGTIPFLPLIFGSVNPGYGRNTIVY